MNKLIKFFLAVGLFMLVLDAYMSFSLVDKYSSSIQQKNKKIEDIANFKEYLSELKDVETGQRGFIITGDQKYLEPYEQGLTYLNSKETQDFLEQSKIPLEESKQLNALTSVKINELKMIVDKYNSSGFQAAKDEVSNNFGKNTMDKIRDLINNIISSKQQALEIEDKNNNNYFRLIIYLILAINLIYLCFCSIFLYLLYLRK